VPLPPPHSLTSHDRELPDIALEGSEAGAASLGGSIEGNQERRLRARANKRGLSVMGGDEGGKEAEGGSFKLDCKNQQTECALSTAAHCIWRYILAVQWGQLIG
jgi:hypothetical protein